ncbi:hypothetical protein IQ26_03805 [Mesorhizobium tianshanense]|uniref:Uncharacterized protein n=1 Tax=Mesorhizobium tianshanense TaxID=39844 RepID=A0A562NPC5_9HYPH|nr:hypothetical protein IQ26_03805 [Mesorhizobium tianshanense]
MCWGWCARPQTIVVGRRVRDLGILLTYVLTRILAVDVAHNPANLVYLSKPKAVRKLGKIFITRNRTANHRNYARDPERIGIYNM